MRLIDADLLEVEIRSLAEKHHDSGDIEFTNGVQKTLTRVRHMPTAERKRETTLVDIFVRDKSDGSIHRVGSNSHDSLSVRDGLVSYYNLQNGEGSGEDSDYTFVDSDWGEIEGREGDYDQT